jgi:LPXTG-motif cell wall-anchored protein
MKRSFIFALVASSAALIAVLSAPSHVATAGKQLASTPTPMTQATPVPSKLSSSSIIIPRGAVMPVTGAGGTYHPSGSTGYVGPQTYSPQYGGSVNQMPLTGGGAGPASPPWLPLGGLSSLLTGALLALRRTRRYGLGRGTLQEKEEC